MLRTFTLLMVPAYVTARFLGTTHMQQMHVALAANESAGNETASPPPGLPEQGYVGDHVEHVDRETYTGDWGKEGGWTKKDEAESKARLKASKQAWRDHYLSGH
eukprot:TRINITY_DN123857_c0_g1_i1.p1 TRINITY_DN123857_c0_g1~~TRINITY_DN123857_c0_g1_i1.p1  ORF type:complete len:104 (-),score=18.01 TRINITY_DN123857_c0_g1_i1:239-550(-)